MSDIMIFKRYEKKYLISRYEYEKLMSIIEEHLIPDVHGRNTICSLYLDTPDFLLIRNSIDAISYKEKLRLRSYGVPEFGKPIFFEIKSREQKFTRRIKPKTSVPVTGIRIEDTIVHLIGLGDHNVHRLQLI